MGVESVNVLCVRLIWGIHVFDIVANIIVRASVELSSVPCLFKGLTQCRLNSFAWQKLIVSYIVYFMIVQLFATMPVRGSG